MDGWLMLKGAASSLTVASPEASRATMARRVGSAKGGEGLVEGVWKRYSFAYLVI
jgi:hypothetical protein